MNISFAHVLRIAASVLGVVSLYGCASTLLSRASVDPGTGWSSEVAGRGQRIIGHDVDIYVKASNSVSSLEDETKRDTFGVSLYFVPKVDNLKFMPAEVSLLLAGTPAIKPMRFDLMIAGNNAGLNIWECGQRYSEPIGKFIYPVVNFESGSQYTLRPGFCADLYFDVQPPSPDTEFVLRIPDLIQNNERIKIPDLQFKKGSGGIIDFPIR